MKLYREYQPLEELACLYRIKPPEEKQTLPAEPVPREPREPRAAAADRRRGSSVPARKSTPRKKKKKRKKGTNKGGFVHTPVKKHRKKKRPTTHEQSKLSVIDETEEKPTHRHVPEAVYSKLQMPANVILGKDSLASLPDIPILKDIASRFSEAQASEHRQSYRSEVSTPRKPMIRVGRNQSMASEGPISPLSTVNSNFKSFDTIDERATPRFHQSRPVMQFFVDEDEVEALKEELSETVEPPLHPLDEMSKFHTFISELSLDNMGVGIDEFEMNQLLDDYTEFSRKNFLVHPDEILRLTSIVNKTELIEDAHLPNHERISLRKKFEKTKQLALEKLSALLITAHSSINDDNSDPTETSSEYITKRRNEDFSEEESTEDFVRKTTPQIPPDFTHSLVETTNSEVVPI